MNRIETANRPWQQSGPDSYVCRVVELDPLPLAEIGAHIEEIAPGNAGCPLHYHLCQEEQFYVLEGTLTVRELPPDADTFREYVLHPGDLVVWPAGTRIAHQLLNRSDAPARFFAMSDRHAHDVCVYPNSGKVMLRGVGVGLFPAARDADTELTLAEASARARARPVVVLADHARPDHVVGGGVGAPSLLAGAKALFVSADRIPPGGRTAELHAHLADEELVYVLSGTPTLRQRRGRRTDEKILLFDASEERLVLGAGDVVHWAAGDLVAHQLCNESDEDVQILTFGTRHAHGVRVYPESGDVRSELLDRRGAFTRTDYWAGERG